MPHPRSAPHLSLVAAGVLGAGLGMAACSGGDLVLPDSAQPAAIELVSGDGQSGSVGSALEAAVVVRVTDARGRPVEDQRVAFTVTSGGAGAGFIPDTARTDAEGKPSARWVLGRSPGSQEGRAAAVVAGGDSTLSVALRATANPGDSRTLSKLGGGGQSARAGSELPDPLVVKLVDQFGNPVSGVPVSWTITGGGSLSAGTVATGSDGRASVRRTLGPTPGPQTASAAVPGAGGSPAVFTHTATASGDGGGGSDSRTLQIASGNNQSGPAGQQLPDPLVIRVVDASGNGVSGQPVTWAVTAGGGTVSPALGVTDSDGRASTRWTLGESGTNTVTAVVVTVGLVTFHATATAASPPAPRATRLAFVVQPSDAGEDKAISPPPRVAVLDAAGNPVASASEEVRVALGRNPEGARLRGDTSRTPSEGVATFSGLKVTKAGDGYTLVASYPGLPSVESTPFRIRD